MRLLSWNVARKLAKLDAQAGFVASVRADVIALQEVTLTSRPRWEAALEAIGCPHTEFSLGPRRHGLLLAAREPVERLDLDWELPWPEVVVSVRTAAGIHVHATHVPNSANGFVKPHTLRAIVAGLAAETAPRILCGDLNTPRKEKPDGTVVTFARDQYGRLRPERGEEWDEAETAILRRVPGMVDAFRALRGFEHRELSWEWPRWGGGYRIDHMLASTDLEVVACGYHHEPRQATLSDHSAMFGEFRPARRARAAPD